jgi:hypothetical protein
VDAVESAARWFSAGLRVIGEQLQKPVSASTQAAYFAALAEETNADEWARFVLAAPKRYGWEFLPTVPKLLDALRSFRGERPVDIEAAEAYERVMASGTYKPEGGTTWNYRTVAEKCGRAAAEAFLAAGGPEAFRVTNEQWNHDKRRNAFVAAYQQAAREEPSARLLPPVDAPKQIEGDKDPRITPTEAKGFLEKLQELLPEASELKAPKLDAFDVRATEERYAEIQRQAALLLAEAIAEPEAVEP